MTQSNSWIKTKDPTAKVISALVTQLSNLEKRLEENNCSTSVALATNGNRKGTLRITVWRTQKGEDSVFCDGKQWYWCSKHKTEGLSNEEELLWEQIEGTLS